ncbi:Os12g0618366, partial [Oryza sativa Japonica Group]
MHNHSPPRDPEAAGVQSLLLLLHPPPLLIRLPLASQVDDEVGGGDGVGERGVEAVGLGGALEDGVDVADLDDGLQRLRAAARVGERVPSLL